MASLIAVATLAGVSIVNAADGAVVDHFLVEMGAEKIKVGEAVDLTIKAVDKDDNVIPSYTGSIFVFSESEDIEYPKGADEIIYKYNDSDAGIVKFENAVKFGKIGIQKILVFDENDDSIYGEGEIEVVDKETVVANKEIVINSPDNNSTIASSEVKVSGVTEASHKVIITINGDKKIETASDEKGNYSINATELKEGENTFEASILDADNNVIGKSEKVKITSKNSNPIMNAITVEPKDDVESGTRAKVTILADAGLEEVSIIFNDALIKLKEVKDGNYAGEITAPAEAGEYLIDVTLKDSLGHTTNKQGAEKMTVKAKPEPIKEEPTKEETPKTEPAKEEPKDVELDSAKLKITGLKLTKLKGKSILSWDVIKEASSYNVYKLDKASGDKKLIENVKEAQTTIYITGDKIEYDDFYVSAVGVNKDGAEEEITDLSDMTKVQTGPAEILFLLLVSMLLGYMIIRRRQA
ncbi:MAG: hypothetical protein N4A38_03760 [Candidatus Gracilibacteria bacterium]|nr:hypothetical protein [Candidatus Gracilibacteria bacterium]